MTRPGDWAAYAVPRPFERGEREAEAAGRARVLFGDIFFREELAESDCDACGKVGCDRVTIAGWYLCEDCKPSDVSCECCDGSATHIAGIDGWRLCDDCDVCGVCDRPATSGLCVDCAATRPGLVMSGGEW